MMTGIPPAAPLWAYENIPHELQALTQWVVWRKEQDDKGKISKVPYNVSTGYKASVTNTADWHSFVTAVDAFNNGRERGLCDGIGMVFHDPISNYAGIDIDDAKGDEGILRAHKRVIAAFKPFGYCETSPSGEGVHIIVKGKIEGHRRAGVEAYSSGRFFTFTGYALCSNPITECQDLLDVLQEELAPNRIVQALLSSEPATADDDTIIKQMFAAKNGAKAQNLFYSVILNSDGSPVSKIDASAVDMALCNIIVWHTKSFEQIERIWLRSKLGQRDKVQRRPAYRLVTIRKAFDRHAAELEARRGIDFAALLARARAEAERATGQAHV